MTNRRRWTLVIVVAVLVAGISLGYPGLVQQDKDVAVCPFVKAGQGAESDTTRHGTRLDSPMPTCPFAKSRSGDAPGTDTSSAEEKATEPVCPFSRGTTGDAVEVEAAPELTLRERKNRV